MILCIKPLYQRRVRIQLCVVTAFVHFVLETLGFMRQ